MSFLALSSAQALALLGVITAAIVVLYWLKPPPQLVVIPTMLIWNRLMEERRRSSLLDRLRWWISLLVALLVGLSIALALTRPEMESSTNGHRKVAIVIDNSPSMSARSADGRSRWDHATDLARRILREGGVSSEYLVIDTAGQVVGSTFSGHRTALERLDTLEVSLVGGTYLPTVDLEGAELYVVSDGVGIDRPPPDATLVSVFTPVDNVGITAFDVRPVPADPSVYEAFVEVTNSATIAKQVTLQISGTGGQRSRSDLMLEPGEAQGSVFDLSSFARGAIRAVVTTEGDGLDADNAAFSWLPVRSGTRVVLVSPGNIYLETILRFDPRFEVISLEPANYRPGLVADVFVFDGFAPPAAPAGPVVLFNPPDVEWLPGAIDELTAPAIGGWDASHPLMISVALEDLRVDRATRVDLEAYPGNPVAVIGSRSAPLVVAGELPGKWVLVNFDLADSNFALQAGFPIFLSNALSWAMDEELPTNISPGRVEVPLAGARITGLDGMELESHEILGSTVFRADRPGLYTATTPSRRLHLAANLLDPRFTDVNRTSFPLEDPRSAAGVLDSVAPVEEGSEHELWLYLLIAAALLVIFEWWAYHRRLTV
jgi:hypothetical protein